MTSAAMYIARTGLDAQDMRMRVISNNLANVNTTGFKKDRAAFETLAYQVVTTPGAQSTAETKYATGLNLGTGVKIQGTARIDTQGAMQTTGNSLEVATKSLLKDALDMVTNCGSDGNVYLFHGRRAHSECGGFAISTTYVHFSFLHPQRVRNQGLQV